jgi:hypothetical protein
VYELESSFSVLEEPLEAGMTLLEMLLLMGCEFRRNSATLFCASDSTLQLSFLDHELAITALGELGVVGDDDEGLA